VNAVVTVSVLVVGGKPFVRYCRAGVGWVFLFDIVACAADTANVENVGPVYWWNLGLFQRPSVPFLLRRWCGFMTASGVG